MNHRRIAEYVVSGQMEMAKRLLNEAVFSAVDGKSERITYKDTELYGVHSIFIGHTIKSTALLYQYLKKRFKRVDKQDILVDPFLYDMDESIKNVLKHESFNFMFHRISEKRLREVPEHEFQQQALLFYERLKESPNETIKNRMDHIISLSNQRDSEIINDLNNSMNLTDEDAIKEVLVNSEYFNRQIEKQAKQLMKETRQQYGASFINKTASFWDSLTNAKVSDKI